MSLYAPANLRAQRPPSHLFSRSHRPYLLCVKCTSLLLASKHGAMKLQDSVPTGMHQGALWGGWIETRPADLPFVCLTFPLRGELRIKKRETNKWGTEEKTTVRIMTTET